MNGVFHPCSVCIFDPVGYPKTCPDGCLFDDLDEVYGHEDSICQNKDCKYRFSDAPCPFSRQCGAYIGGGKTDLDFKRYFEEGEE